MSNALFTHSLSPRENQILQLAARGRTDKEIAAQLNCQLSTVRTYWERIRQKLNAHNKVHAVMLGQASQVDRAGQEVSEFILRRIADEAIFVCDKEGNILTWNEGVLQLLGYDEAEWVGQHQSIMFLPEEKDEAKREIDDAAAAGASVNDRWHVRKDGSRFWGTNTVITLDPPINHGSFGKIVRLKI